MAETNKTEKATSKKRRDERKKGNVFKSRDIVSVGSLLIGFFMAVKLGGFIAEQVKGLYLRTMDLAGTLEEMTIAQSGLIARDVATVVAVSALPIMAAMVLIAIVANGAQTNWLIAGDLIKFKGNRINPLEGMKRLFSVRSWVELIKSVIKIAVIFLLVYNTLKGLLVVAPDILNTRMDEGLRYMIDRIMHMVYPVCLIFTGVAALDYFYQRYEYEKKLRMSKQEVKDEFKQLEGDPKIKGKRREKQREISMSRMIQQVPQADVVVRNPTHFAVALRYDIDKDFAPVVLAKGKDRVAERIIAVAEAHAVLMTENPPLAQSLYAAADVGGYVPTEFYNAVAEVMAWVYEKQNRKTIKTQ